jgi:hypothetical protein
MGRQSKTRLAFSFEEPRVAVYRCRQGAVSLHRSDPKVRNVNNATTRLHI